MVHDDTVKKNVEYAQAALLKELLSLPSTFTIRYLKKLLIDISSLAYPKEFVPSFGTTEPSVTSSSTQPGTVYETT